MGYTGKLVEKQIAQKLRSQGLSYGEIQRTVKVSKATLSVWCKDIELNSTQKTNPQITRFQGVYIAWPAEEEIICVHGIPQSKELKLQD